MNRPNGDDARWRCGEGKWADARDEVRRAFTSFLAVPSLIIVGFLLLALTSYKIDRGDFFWSEPLLDFMRARFFGDSKATGDLLGSIATSLTTVTSLSFALLLLGVQQTGGALTHQVIDQFLRRRINQIYFGFFVGLALYALVILATVKPSYNPVAGASLALALMGVALYLLLLLLYTTINQIRPVTVVEAIHDHTLRARQAQLPLLARTRRASRFSGAVSVPVAVQKDGFVVALDLEKLGQACAAARGEVEVVLEVSIGSFVAFGETIAQVKAASPEDAAAVAARVAAAVRLERQRRLEGDPGYGIEQLLTIAWTSVSTAKSNPAPGLLVIRNLRDLLSRWVCAPDNAAQDDAEQAGALPLVYHDDVLDDIMDALESIAVVSSESMQHQSWAEVARTFALIFDRLPAPQQERAEDVIRRLLSCLGDFVCTADLDAALSRLARVLEAAARFETAREVRAAQTQMRASIGQLHSRSTRASTAAP